MKEQRNAISTESYKGYSDIRYNIRHDTNQIYLKCPECLLNSKNPIRVKTHKSLSSLESHISTSHKGEFWIKEVQILIRQFSEAVIKQ